MNTEVIGKVGKADPPSHLRLVPDSPPAECETRFDSFTFARNGSSILRVLHNGREGSRADALIHLARVIKDLVGTVQAELGTVPTLDARPICAETEGDCS